MAALRCRAPADRDEHDRRERDASPDLAGHPAAAHELEDDVIHRRPALSRVCAEAARDDLHQPARDLATSRRGCDPTGLDRGEPLVGILDPERPHAGDELVDHRAERPLVRTRTDLSRGELLGRHVHRRAHPRTGAGEHAGAGRRVVAGRELRSRVDPGEPEIGDPRAAVAADEDVVGLDVAMDDARGVCGREPAPGVDQAVEDLGERPLVAADPRREVAALDELHREEHGVLVRSDVEHRHDVRMRQAREHARLSHHSLTSLRAELAGVEAQELHRDPAMQLGVGCRVDHAHPAGAEPLAEDVAADPRAFLQRRGPAGRAIAGAIGGLQQPRDQRVTARTRCRVHGDRGALALGERIGNQCRQCVRVGAPHQRSLYRRESWVGSAIVLT